MPDARAAARTFIAELHAATDCPHAYNPCANCLTDAILSAPGVEVAEERMRLVDGIAAVTGLLDATHTQPVIRLPAQPIREAP